MLHLVTWEVRGKLMDKNSKGKMVNAVWGDGGWQGRTEQVARPDYFRFLSMSFNTQKVSLGIGRGPHS